MIDSISIGLKKLAMIRNIMLIGLIVSTNLTAQTRTIKEKMEDAFDEAENDLLTLYIKDAINGNAIYYGTMLFPDGIEYNITDGKVKFPIISDGIYSVLFNVEGYVRTKYNLEIMAGSLFLDRISLSPLMSLDEMRIVLDWSKEPNDLDAHFTKGNIYHISFQNMHIADDGKVILDKDSRSGYGPETITVKQISPTTEYQYWIHDYSNRGQKSSEYLSQSRAKVKIFLKNMLVHTITVPQKKKGEIWRVFSIKEGAIMIHNIIQ